METITCRLLPFALGDGPTNMAADEVLLQSAQAGLASLRFYGWTEATVSLGYFQASALRQADPKLRALPFVRRPTGGATLLHHHELTYALALPEAVRRLAGTPWLLRMHRIIAAALNGLGVSCRSAEDQDKSPSHSALCFQQFTPGDLLVDGNKIAGSAQRRQKGCLLQHGAILLTASPHAPWLPGILEAARRDLSPEVCRDAIMEAFRRDTAWEVHELPWSRQEQGALTRLVNEKYSCTEWNNKR